MIRVIEFRTEYNVGKDPRDLVLVAPMGEDFERTQTWHYVHQINPERWPENKRGGASYQDAVAKWTVIEPAYEAWKKGTEIPLDGTPLEAWAGVTKEMAAALKKLDVRTVEEVRDMGDGVMAKLRVPNARNLPDLARKYLEGQSASEKDAQIAEMAERMAAMEAMLEEASKPKRGPGRPKKVAEETA